MKACCKGPRTLTLSLPESNKLVGACQVCGAKHVRFYAEPGKYKASKD